MVTIDGHAHIYPESYWRALSKIAERVTFPIDVQRILYFFPKESVLVQAEETLGLMENLGIGGMVLSLSLPNVYMPDSAMSLDLAQMANDAYADIQRRFPGKFYVLASIPLHFPELAIRELDRAIEKLKMNGIVLGSNIAGKPLSSREFFPFYERVNALELPIFIHPMSPPHADQKDEFFLIPLVDYISESTRAVVGMIFAGVFEQFRNVTLVLPHLGGAIPYIKGRIDGGYQNHLPCQKNISKPPSEYFKEFYFDTVSLDVQALRYALETVGPEHLVFGTDYPFMSLKNIRLIKENLYKVSLSPRDREGIEGKNVLRLLKNLGI